MSDMTINNDPNQANRAEQIASLRSEFAFIHEQVVAWGDMDALNHLNNVVYYRYAESARIGYLEALELFNDNVQVVLAQSSCQYLRPVVFPDTLQIGVRCKHLGNTSMVMSYAYFSQSQNQIVATAESVLVRLDPQTMQKVAWQEGERQQIASFDSQASSKEVP